MLMLLNEFGDNEIALYYILFPSKYQNFEEN